MKFKALARELACVIAERNPGSVTVEIANSLLEEFLRTAGYLVSLWRREIHSLQSGDVRLPVVGPFEEITFVWMFVRVIAATWACRAVQAGSMRDTTFVLAQLRRDACAVHQVLEWLEHQGTLPERVQMSRFRRQVSAWTDSLLASSALYPMTLDFGLDPERCREFAFDHNLNLDEVHATAADAMRLASLTSLVGEKRVTHPLRGAVCRRLQMLAHELLNAHDPGDESRSEMERCIPLPEAEERDGQSASPQSCRPVRKATA